MCNDIESVEVIERELSENGFFVSNTLGVSMQPLFKTHRDMVIIKRPDRELRKYDVVLYKDKAARYILHRIIKVCEDFYVIRGDNTYAKEYVPKENVIGVLTSYRNKMKRHSVEDFSFKLYSRFWNFIYPLRYLKRKLRIALGRIYKKLFKKAK